MSSRKVTSQIVSFAKKKISAFFHTTSKWQSKLNSALPMTQATKNKEKLFQVDGTLITSQ